MGLALATLAGVTVLVALVSEIFVESVQQAAETFGMTPAFVGFIVVALVGGAAEMASAFSAARKNRLDLSVGIALGSAVPDRAVRRPGPGAAQLRDRPVADEPAVLAGRGGHDAYCHDDRVLVTNSGRSAWFVGVLVLMVYLIFAMTLYLLPPGLLSATPCGPTPNKVTFSLSRPAPQDVDKVHEPAALRCCRIEQLFARRRLGEAADLR